MAIPKDRQGHPDFAFHYMKRKAEKLQAENRQLLNETISAHAVLNLAQEHIAKLSGEEFGPIKDLLEKSPVIDQIIDHISNLERAARVLMEFDGDIKKAKYDMARLKLKESQSVTIKCPLKRLLAANDVIVELKGGG